MQSPQIKEEKYFLLICAKETSYDCVCVCVSGSNNSKYTIDIVCKRIHCAVCVVTIVATTYMTNINVRKVAQFATTKSLVNGNTSTKTRKTRRRSE